MLEQRHGITKKFLTNMLGCEKHSLLRWHYDINFSEYGKEIFDSRLSIVLML
jgi:hypothetical protein